MQMPGKGTSINREQGDDKIYLLGYRNGRCDNRSCRNRADSA